MVYLDTMGRQKESRACGCGRGLWEPTLGSQDCGYAGVLATEASRRLSVSLAGLGCGLGEDTAGLCQGGNFLASRTKARLN